MRGIVNFLSSLKLAAILSIAGMCSFFAGALLLAFDDTYYSAFDFLNHTLVAAWLMDASSNALVRWWLVIVVSILFSLGLNLLFCSRHWLLKLLKRAINKRQIYLLLMHIMFGMVLLGHLLSAVSGVKIGHIQLTQGEEYPFGERYVLRVEGVQSAGGLNLYKKGIKRAEIMPGDYDANLKDNHVTVSLAENGEVVARKNLFFYRSLRYKTLQVTLTDMRAVSTNELDEKPKMVICGVFTISNNPGTIIMLIANPLMIVAILVFLCHSWKREKWKK